MGYMLYAPYNDADFVAVASGGPPPTIGFSYWIDTIGTRTVEIPMPSVGGEAVEGGVYWNLPQNYGAGSLLNAIKTLLDADDPGPAAQWNINYKPETAGELSVRIRIRRLSADGLDWRIMWSDANHDLDPRILGYDSFGVDGPITGIGTYYNADWNPGRTWFHPLDRYVEQDLTHRGVHLISGSADGGQQIVAIGDRTYQMELECKPVEGVRVHRSIANDPTIIAQLPGLQLGDLNTPIEAWWEAVCIGRTPIKLLDDPFNFDINNVSTWQIGDPAVLSNVNRLTTNRKNRPRYFDLKIPLQTYVAP